VNWQDNAEAIYEAFESAYVEHRDHPKSKPKIHLWIKLFGRDRGEPQPVPDYDEILRLESECEIKAPAGDPGTSDFTSNRGWIAQDRRVVLYASEVDETQKKLDVTRCKVCQTPFTESDPPVAHWWGNICGWCQKVRHSELTQIELGNTTALEVETLAADHYRIDSRIQPRCYKKIQCNCGCWPCVGPHTARAGLLLPPIA
jgi:hypothetical protein